MPPKWMDIIGQMKGKGIDFAPALTDADVVSIESTFSFRFPPDLRAFLQTAVPQGKQFPDWHSGSKADLREWLAIPREGVLFDIEHNHFWLTEWGQRPESISEALQCAQSLLAAAPKLIPIYGHRMMPDDPQIEDNPVFSVHQTDIIYYGYDLEDYLRHDFKLPGRRPWPDNLRPIRFWDIDRFQEVRWANGSCVFDNRRDILP
ncbi:MAG TPA: SMI1/KNR4 family protein [Candidatus Angelobacter sp.]|nr:SMI1/KNR4 family protein [Candidatus Angelobacter sp.]